MRCPHCNTKNNDHAIFCKHCNAWILGSLSPESSKRAKKKKQKWLIPVISCACFALVLCLAILLRPETPDATTPTTITPSSTPTAPTTSAPPATTEPTTPSDLFYSADYVQWQSYLRVLHSGNNKLAFLMDDTTLLTEETVSGLYRHYSWTSTMDGLSAVYRQQFGGKLYHLHDNTFTSIDTQVQDFQFSMSGDGVAYEKADNSLWLYHTQQDTPVHIADDVKSYLISPDGKTVAYTKLESTAEEDETECDVLYLYRGETTILTKRNTSIVLLSVSNDEGWVYIMQDNNILSIDYGGNEVEVGTWGNISRPNDDGVYSVAMALNSSFTQLMFCNKDGTFLSQNGQPGQKISDAVLRPIVPELTSSRPAGHAFIYPILDLTDHLYFSTDFSDTTERYTHKIIWKLDADLTVTALASQVTDYWLDPTGRYIYCQDTSKALSRIDAEDGSITPMAEEVKIFSVAYDCGKVYYTDYEDALFVCDGATGENVAQITTAAVKTLFVTRDGMLYYLSDNTIFAYDPDSIVTTVIADVKDYILSPHGVLYVVDSTGLYIANEHGEFTYMGKYTFPYH